MTSIKSILLIVCLFLGTQSAFSQQRAKRSTGSNWYGLSIRNNLAYDAIGTPNIGLEAAVGKHVTLGVDGSFKNWPRFLFWDMDTVENPTQWRHFLVDAEVRYYPNQVFTGWFLGAGAVYSHFNLGSIPVPWGLYPNIREHRSQGDFVGGTLFGGYSWWLGKHWRIELEGGVAVGAALYERFDCPHCGTKLGDERGLAILPKIGINLAYNPLARKQSKKGKR